jgi:hypothetical protein
MIGDVRRTELLLLRTQKLYAVNLDIIPVPLCRQWQVFQQTSEHKRSSLWSWVLPLFQACLLGIHAWWSLRSNPYHRIFRTGRSRRHPSKSAAPQFMDVGGMDLERKAARPLGSCRERLRIRAYKSGNQLRRDHIYHV